MNRNKLATGKTKINKISRSTRIYYASSRGVVLFGSVTQIDEVLKLFEPHLSRLQGASVRGGVMHKAAYGGTCACHLDISVET